MGRTRSIRFRQSRPQFRSVLYLNLTSLLDILIIVLIFLLKTHTASPTYFAPSPDIRLPLADSKVIPPEAFELSISPDLISFEHKKVLQFQEHYTFPKRLLKEQGHLIVPLLKALEKQREKLELELAHSSARTQEGKPLPFRGMIAIKADKTVPYTVLKKILYTGAQAGFTSYHLLAISKDSFAPPTAQKP